MFSELGLSDRQAISISKRLCAHAVSPAGCFYRLCQGPAFIPILLWPEITSHKEDGEGTKENECITDDILGSGAQAERQYRCNEKQEVLRYDQPQIAFL